MSLRSPLGRVLGLGSAKSGHGHWWAQRLTAAALVPLGLWFLVSLAGLAGADHAIVAAWMREPLHAVLLLLTLATLLYHSNLGLQVVIEDYVGRAPAKVITLVLIRFAHVGLAAAGSYSILSVSLGGAA